MKSRSGLNAYQAPRPAMIKTSKTTFTVFDMFQILLSDFLTNCWSRTRTNPYSLISRGGRTFVKPLRFQQLSQFRPAAMEQHPEIIRRDVQDFADFTCREAVDFSK